MRKTNTLITFASWEDRFIAGFERSLERYAPQRVIMYFYDGYADWTLENRTRVGSACSERRIPLVEHELVVQNPKNNWYVLRRDIATDQTLAGPTAIDITTMPRDVIWTTLWFLEYRGAEVHFAYHRPESYNDQWLSRDPQRPRLVYRLSGMAALGARTALLVIAGYDLERCHQLIEVFEPAITSLGLQRGNGDSQNPAKMQEHRDEFVENNQVTLFDVDAYSDDHGERAIMDQMAPHLETHNVVMSSIGPKLSAIALYRIQRSHPKVGLAYAPSREFNRDYSSGLADSIYGQL